MIRAKITPTVLTENQTAPDGSEMPSGTVHLLIEWVDMLEGEQIVSVLFSEEFAVRPEKAGAAYVSRCEFENGNKRDGSFWVDRHGLRHFGMSADPGQLGMVSRDTSLCR